MLAGQVITTELLDKVHFSFERARTCIQNSTSTLRKAYQQDESVLDRQTQIFRRRLYSEGIMYGTHVYPDTIQLVTETKETMENYVYLEYADFANSVEDVREECLRLSVRAGRAQRYHRYSLQKLKALENEMRQSIGTLKNNVITLRSKAADHRSTGGTMKLMGAVAAVIAAVDGGMTLAAVAAIGGQWGGTKLDSCATNAEARAVAALQNTNMLHQLVESVEGLVEAVDLVASFAAILENELVGIAKIGVGAQFKIVHWKKMTGKASTLVESCRHFISVEPAIRSDLLSIKEKLDEEYVAEWRRGLTN